MNSDLQNLDVSVQVDFSSDQPIEESSTPSEIDWAARQGIRYAYRLALGRDPESDAVIEGNLGILLVELLDSLFGSIEFFSNVNQRILRHRRPRGNLFDTPPSADLIGWICQEIPISDHLKSNLSEAAQDWTSFYYALITDEQFGKLIGGRLQPSRLAVVEALRQIISNAGKPEAELEIEEAREHEIRGWALDPKDPDRLLVLHLFLDGSFAGSISPDRFRRDLQDQFGGAGRYGFVAKIPKQWRGLNQTIQAEFRDSSGGGEVLARIEIHSSAPSHDEVQKIVLELSRVRQSLKNIEASLPNIQAGYTLSLDRYDEYAEIYYPELPPSARSFSRARSSVRSVAGVPISLILDSTGLSADRIADILERITQQTHVFWDCKLLFDVDEETVLADLAQRVRLTNNRPLEIHRVSRSTFVDALNTAVITSRHDNLVIVSGTSLLSRSALSNLSSAFLANPDAAVIFGDDDLVNDDGLRSEPNFRPAFDLDYFIQRPDLGCVLGFRKSNLLEQGGFRPSTVDVSANELVLALALNDQKIVHVEAVLASHRQSQPLPSNWLNVVELAAKSKDLFVNLDEHRDELGRSEPGMLRVRRSALLRNRRATVIIASRDKPELLGPCIQSLLGSRPHNQIEYDIIVVDNGSVLSTTKSLLDEISASCKIISFETPFNWALLNNSAVEHTQSDVLIFLNDDTLVISPDWCDALCEEALRPEVGAVGARLLYADGTIQHAGIVLRGQQSYAAHEGVGESPMAGGYLMRHSVVRETMAVTGACLATRREVFLESGGFDSVLFPVEGNDVDYCLKLRSAGLKVLFTPFATLHHLESQSRGVSLSPEKKLIADKAVEDLWRRWSDHFPIDPFFNAHFDRRAAPFTSLRPPPQTS